MEIKLDDKYYLKSDSRSYQICKEIINEDKENTFLNLLHYTTLESALNGYVELKIREGDFKSLKQLKNDLDEIKEKIIEIIQIIKNIKK